MGSAVRSLHARPDLKFLKKLAKKRLAAMRADQPGAKLSAAQLAIAREHGFASWRALKAHIDQLHEQLGAHREISNPGRLGQLVDGFLAAAIHDFQANSIRRAEELLRTEPGLATANIYALCVTANQKRMERLLRRDPALATTAGGPRGWRPILYLCYSRYSQKRRRSGQRFARCAQLLLKHGADPNDFWMNGTWRETALYGASGIANCAPLTKVLLDAGGDPNKPDLETLYHTAEFKDHACLKLVLKKVARGDWLNYCMGHKLDMEDATGLQLFLDHGADPNHQEKGHNAMRGMRPLHFAIYRHRSSRIIRVLLKAGADPNLGDAQGVTPLGLARRLGHREAARVLIHAGAVDHSTPREDAIAAVMLGDESAVRRLIPCPPEFVRSLTEDEKKLLPHAAEAGNLKAIRLMLDLGWNIETPGAWNGTALHQAIYHGHADGVEFLLSRGARIGHKNEFGGNAMGTAVHAALHGRHKSALEIVHLVGTHMRRRSFGHHIEAARDQGNQELARALEELANR